MSSYTIKKTPGDSSWFTADKFGMFIHFGLYSMPARHEWVKSIERIPEEKYDIYFKHFNPDMLDMKEWESEELFKVVRELQPHILINDRAEIEQDLVTPEQRLPTKWLTHNETGEKILWEGCQTMSGSWGYNRDEMTWKSPEMLIETLINIVCLGGNLIMNVGPTSRGCFDYRAEEALKVYAEWMKYNSRSIYGCTMAEPEIPEPKGCRLTQSVDGKRLYVHLMEYPFRFLELPGLRGKVEYAQFLHDGSEVLINNNPTKTMAIKHYTERAEVENLIVLQLPTVKPKVTVPVIELFLKDEDGTDFSTSQAIF